jgi:hypothetical protein
MGWASFHCLEVMSQARFWHKQAGYLAMCTSFPDHSELLLLATNLFKKDLHSTNQVSHNPSHAAHPPLFRDNRDWLPVYLVCSTGTSMFLLKAWRDVLGACADSVWWVPSSLLSMRLGRPSTPFRAS